MITKAAIVELLKTDDRAIVRALLVLNARQTADEQVQETTKYHNGIGFKSCDAKRGTGMAKFFTDRGFLTPKQIAWWRKLDKKGNMKIAAYAGQLLEAAQEKARNKV